MSDYTDAWAAYTAALRAAEDRMRDDFAASWHAYQNGYITQEEWKLADRATQARFDLEVATAAALRDFVTG